MKMLGPCKSRAFMRSAFRTRSTVVAVHHVCCMCQASCINSMVCDVMVMAKCGVANRAEAQRSYRPPAAAGVDNYTLHKFLNVDSSLLSSVAQV